MYKKIIDQNLFPFVSKRGLRRNNVFQQNNNPKYTYHLVQKYFQEWKMKLLEWPPSKVQIQFQFKVWNE